MYIAKEIILPNNGVTVTCHRLGAVQLGSVQARIWVDHCAAPDAPAFVFQQDYVLDLGDLGGVMPADVAAALVAPGGPLEGGTVIAEPIGTLDQAKVLARQAVNAARDRAEFGGCATPHGRRRGADGDDRRGGQRAVLDRLDDGG